MLSERYEHQGNWEEEVMPERLCGGTFRTRRGRKRKRGVKTEELTYAERQQRRIERKFGRNGQALGGEEETRVKLENGKKPKGKPRVAGSARGRELRAAAALARFGAQKAEEEEVKKEETLHASESDSGSDFEDVKPEKEALDLDGSKLLDGKGRGMVKVCEDEDQDDVQVKQEMDELHELATIETHKEPSRRHDGRETRRHEKKKPRGFDENSEGTQSGPAPISIKREDIPTPQLPKPEDERPGTTAAIKREASPPAPKHPLEHPTQESISPSTSSDPPSTESSCPICSMANEPSALVCIVCSHVLQPRLMPGNWRCQSSACQGSKYINAGDCGICGVCGKSKLQSLR